MNDSNSLTATLQTDKGEIVIRLFADKAPITVASFVNLASRGYYDGITFHRVIKGFMIQGGDPTGTGRGGPGYTFEDEFDPSLRHDSAGILSMANAGPETNGSQFFITHDATPHLDGKHTVFGKVVTGLDVVMKIGQGDSIKTVSLEGDVDGFLSEQADRVNEWNKTLDKTHPAK